MPGENAKKANLYAYFILKTHLFANLVLYLSLNMFNNVLNLKELSAMYIDTCVLNMDISASFIWLSHKLQQ